MRPLFWSYALFLFGAAVVGAPLAAQTSDVPADPSVRLREVLPPDVAAHVLAVIADARVHGLPANALEQRALKFAARGVPAIDIARAVGEHADRQARAKTLLDALRGSSTSGDEVEAGAEAMREGVDAGAVSALARSAPSARSLTIPLYVLGSLTAAGVPADQALARVNDRLAAGASDSDLEALSARAANAHGGTPGAAEPELGAARRSSAPTGADRGQGNGPPTDVPVNGGQRAHSEKPPAGPPGKPGKP